MTDVLVLFYSRHGTTAAMARQIARGVESVDGIAARMRTVPSVKAGEATIDTPDSGPPFATQDDLADCEGIIVGSPGRFGNMAGAMKVFFDSTSPVWLRGGLAGKPGGVFCSTSTMHGGQESTLISMMIPLLHHGVMLLGVPYTEPALTETQTGGTPYGPSALAITDSKPSLSDHETTICRAFGKRVAETVRQLAG